jgi:hypothetical protein
MLRTYSNYFNFELILVLFGYNWTLKAGQIVA